MSAAHGLHTAGAAARRAHRGGTSTTARLPRGAVGAAAAVLLLRACAAWALPGALAADAPAAVPAADGGAGSGVAVAASLPQLAIQSGGIRYDIYSTRILALPGSKFTIGVTVLNTGTGDLPAKQAVLRVWSQDSASFPDKACGEPGNASVVLPGLPAGVGALIGVSGIPAPSVVGTYTLRVFLDADCQVAEADDSLDAHQGVAAYEVVDASTALPTLGFYARINSALVKAGKKTKALLYLYNFGVVPSRPGMLALIISNHTDVLTPSCAGLPEASGTWTKVTPKVSIPGGGNVFLSVSVPVPKFSGQVALHVIINADCSITEDTSINVLPHYRQILFTIP